MIVAATPEIPVTSAVKPARIDSVDLLRGVVMVLMALDHVRDYFTDVRFNPLDLTQTNAALYLTRWITHFCAPTFVFLAGTGVFLSLHRGKTKPELSKFLFTRGLWLVFLELTWVRFGWLFNLDYSLVILQVIWAIGWSMVAMSGLLFLSTRAVAIIGVAIVLLHNVLDGIGPEQFGAYAGLWQVFFFRGQIAYASGHIADAGYALIPWLGVMASGYGFGSIMLLEEKRRRKLLLQLGLGMTAAFIVIRGTNLYGDPRPWAPQQDLLFTVFDFIKCEKYPPSLLFVLMTIGPAITSLAFFERMSGRIAQFFQVFGRVPMFYYLLHVPLIHGLAVVAYYVAGFDTSVMFLNVGPWNWPAGSGFNLGLVYLAWACVIAMLYPLCRWFAELKRRRKEAWLSYF